MKILASMLFFLIGCAPPPTGTWEGPYELTQRFGDIRLKGNISLTFTKTTYTSTGFDVDALCRATIDTEEGPKNAERFVLKGTFQATSLYLRHYLASEKTEIIFQGNVYQDAIVGTLEIRDGREVLSGRITLLRIRAGREREK